MFLLLPYLFGRAGNHKQRIFREVKTDKGQGQDTQGKGGGLAAVFICIPSTFGNYHWYTINV